jgi:hypothetical protein
MHICIYVLIYVHMHVCVYMFVCMCVYVCVFSPLNRPCTPVPFKYSATRRNVENNRSVGRLTMEWVKLCHHSHISSSNTFVYGFHFVACIIKTVICVI